MVTLRIANIALVATSAFLMAALLSESTVQLAMAVAALVMAGQLVGQADRG